MSQGRPPCPAGAHGSCKDRTHGVIADFDITREMIAHFVGKCISGLRLVKPSMVICIPTGITQVEKKAVIDAALLSGARSVSLVEEPMAAAIGAGMLVQEPLGNLVLDIGGACSSARSTVSTTAWTGSCRASQMSPSVTVTTRGPP